MVAIRSAGFRVDEARDGGDALGRILSARNAGDPFHLVITDIRMPAMSGIELIDALGKHQVETAICAITCFGDRNLLSELAAKGCTEYLEKPFAPTDLVERIRAILQDDPL